MPTIKEQIGDEQKKLPESQSPERVEVASRVWGMFDIARTERDQSQDLFRGRTLRQYTNQNIKRFIQYKRRPAHKRKWQSNLASSTANEKLIGVLSKLAMQGMEARAMSTKELSAVEYAKERISNMMLKHAAKKNDDDFQLVLEMLAAAELGTVIGFEDWKHGNKIVREVTDQDPKTGELQFEEKVVKEWNDVRSSLVNLEDFYPGNIYVRPGMIQDMDFCFLRTKMTRDEFDIEFGHFPDADKVQARDHGIVNESTPFWKQSDDVQNDMIEVVRYFNKATDEYVILADEVWINSKGASTVSPLPWNHKKLPFWAAVFEPFDTEFFYGRAMPDKLASFIDSKDGLLDSMIDQIRLSVSKPVVTDGQTASAMTKGFLQPNNVIVSDWSKGRPNFEIVPIPEPSNMSVTLYNILQQNLEKTSIAAEAIGGSSSKKKTATETEIQRQGALETISLFLKMMEKGIKKKNTLRLANQFQFYSLPSNSDEGAEIFKTVILRDEKLSNGQQGDLQISIVTEQSQKRVQELSDSMVEPTEIIEITPAAIRSMEMGIEIVPQSSIKMTEIQRRLLETNYQKVMNEMYPDKFNRDFGFDQLNRVYDKDPRKARVQNTGGPGVQPPGAPQAPGAPGAGAPGAPAIPGAPTAAGQGIKLPETTKITQQLG